MSMALPHFTSKISTFHDLCTLETFGFRGEALHSLAAMSSLRVSTRTDQEEVAHTYEFDCKGEVIASRAIALDKGTSVVVAKLFKDFPVRRQRYKNVKQCKEELRKVEDYLLAFGICHPEVRFELRHNKHTLWQKLQAPNFEANVEEILGPSSFQQMTALNYQCFDPMVKIKAFVPKSHGSVSGLTRATGDRIFLLVNKRPVMLKTLVQLVRRAFSEAFPCHASRYPMAIITITVLPQALDVNLEPNKTSVLLHDLDFISTTLGSLLEQTYGPCRVAVKGPPAMARLSSNVSLKAVRDKKIQEEEEEMRSGCAEEQKETGSGSAEEEERSGKEEEVRSGIEEGEEEVRSGNAKEEQVRSGITEEEEEVRSASAEEGGVMGVEVEERGFVVHDEDPKEVENTGTNSFSNGFDGNKASLSTTSEELDLSDLTKEMLEHMEEDSTEDMVCSPDRGHLSAAVVQTSLSQWSRGSSCQGLDKQSVRICVPKDSTPNQPKSKLIRKKPAPTFDMINSQPVKRKSSSPCTQESNKRQKQLSWQAEGSRRCTADGEIEYDLNRVTRRNCLLGSEDSSNSKSVSSPEPRVVGSCDLLQAGQRIWLVVHEGAIACIKAQDGDETLLEKSASMNDVEMLLDSKAGTSAHRNLLFHHLHKL